MEALDIIRKTMPEFEKVDDDTIKTFISLAEPLISKKRFGKLYEQALAYLSAHKMKLRGLGTSIGIGTIGDTFGLSSVSEGETSVSFSSTQQSRLGEADGYYALTIYGTEYLNLIKWVAIPIVCGGETVISG